MTMNRRDIILLSVVINVGLLTLLLMTAVQQETPDSEERRNPSLSNVIINEPKNMINNESLEPSQSFNSTDETEVSDELDALLQDYSHFENADQPRDSKAENTVEITVKWGDALEKIARANGTTVAAIRKLNHLENDRLKIGQVLIVPKAVPVKEEASFVAAPKVDVLPLSESNTGAIHYVVEKGDNPWIIARKFHVSYTEILRLNALNEESARNLRPGDRIRVK